jgi:hypothetical protein
MPHKMQYNLGGLKMRIIVSIHYIGLIGFFLLLINLIRYFLITPEYIFREKGKIIGKKVNLIHFLFGVRKHDTDERYSDDRKSLWFFAFILPSGFYFVPEYFDKFLSAEESMVFDRIILGRILTTGLPPSILGILYIIIGLFVKIFK